MVTVKVFRADMCGFAPLQVRERIITDGALPIMKVLIIVIRKYLNEIFLVGKLHKTKLQEPV